MSWADEAPRPTSPDLSRWGGATSWTDEQPEPPGSPPLTASQFIMSEAQKSEKPSEEQEDSVEERKWSPKRARQASILDAMLTPVKKAQTVVPQWHRARRQLLQLILRRYMTQLLYGCSHPLCSTTTCMTYRKNHSAGPFRNYTILSARALATSLVLEDHPERGLCPYLSLSTAIREREHAALAKESRTVQPPQHDDVPAESSDTAPQEEGVQDAGANLRAGALEISLLAAGQDVRGPDEFADRQSTKDPKSFSQNLFDTAAMRSLFSAYNDRATHDSSSYGCAGNFRKGSIGGESSIDGTASTLESSASMPSSGRAFISSRPPDPLRKSGWSEEGKLEPWERLQGMTDSEIRATFEESMKGCRTPSVKTRYAAASNTENGPGFNTRHGRTPSTSPSTSPSTNFERHTSMYGKTFRSLSCVVIMMFVQHHRMPRVDQDEYMSMLAQFGRDHEYRRTAAQTEALNLLEQSTICVCGNAEALLASFIIGRHETSPGTLIAESMEFMIFGLFTLLAVGVRLETMLSSFRTSLGDIFVSPRNFKEHKPHDLRVEAMGQTDSETSPLLSDTEAAHILKATFAALLATLPTVPSPILRTVQECRGSGLATPYGHGLKFDEESFDKETDLCHVQQIIDSLQDEMAISLAKEACKAIASRALASDFCTCSQVNKVYGAAHRCLCRHTSFPRLVARAIMNDSALAQDDLEGSFPTLRGGKPQSPVKIRNMWEPISQDDFALVIEWLRTVVLREWRGELELSQNTAINGALMLWQALDHCAPAGLAHHSAFHTPYISQGLDVIDLAAKWADNVADCRKIHLFNYSFLFHPAFRVSYFRAVNFQRMKSAVDRCLANVQLLDRVTSPDPRSHRAESRIHYQLQSVTDEYLVLKIRRDNLLVDAMDALWRRRPHELLKPLKVLMGMDEGEEGLDLGGVQQEFFRLAIAEALSPDYGLFTIEPDSNISWFQPYTFEPPEKFELVGLLCSLAVYNGITLPVTFPIVLYARILGFEFEGISWIEDAWPRVASGLRELRGWKDGDVADVYMRSYTFNLSDFVDGSTKEYDMYADKVRTGHNNASSSQRTEGFTSNSQYAESWSDSKEHSHMSGATAKRDSPAHDGVASSRLLSSKSAHPGAKDSASNGDFASEYSTPLVTNANREEYITDYIEYLTGVSVAPQLSAFVRGFRRCLDEQTTAFLGVDVLRKLVEGNQEIDTHDLARITEYDGGYNADHEVVRWFWTVVHGWAEQKDGGQEKVRKLLEFVTASDRLPIGGASRIIFVIQKNGRGDERLPTSLTCFGRLLLPEYSDLQSLRTSLERAIQESTGFGTS